VKRQHTHQETNIIDGSASLDPSYSLKFLIVKEPITDVIEIEAKKAGTINEKTFYRLCPISFCVTVHV
jgi:hypothetical protein